MWRGEIAEQARAWEFEAKGGIIVASRDSSMRSLERVLNAQREHGIRVEPLSAEQLREAEPYVNPEAVGAAYYPDDAQVMPILAVHGLVQMARQCQAHVHPHTKVEAFIRDGERVTGVRTQRGDFYAGVCVNAAGPWAGEVSLLAGAGVPVVPRRGYVIVTEPMPPRVHHKVYAAEYIDNVGSADEALQCSPVVESTPAGSILIGSSRERVGFSHEINREALRRISENGIALFPFLRSVRALRFYHGFRPYSPDHLPIIGPDERAPGLWHATGHEGAGIGLSVGTGKLIAQSIVGSPDMSLEPFNPTRFATSTGADRP